MPRDEILRREGYGPTSAGVGRRGAHTRQRIIAEALRQFEVHGYYATSFKTIAKAIGISPPTLYQYFESKQQIFRELLEECGRALARLVRRIGPLGPTKIGFDNLHWWLGEWAYTYDKYAAMHVQWAIINAADNPLRPMVAGFLARFHEHIAERLRTAEFNELDPLDAANALTSTVHRFLYLIHSDFAPPREDDVLLDGLAAAMQLMLFPQTPGNALTAIIAIPPPPLSEAGQWAHFANVRKPSSTPGTGAGRPLREVGPRGEATRRMILDEGARMITERGYHETRIDDLMAGMGLSRGTFYKNFPEKIDLLLELAEECASAFEWLAARFAAIDPNRDVRGQLRDWLHDYLPVRARYFGVIAAWLAGSWTDPRLMPTATRAVGAQHQAVIEVLRQLGRNYPFDSAVAATVMSSMLERLPATLFETRVRSQPETAEVMAALIDRALFSTGG